MQLPSEAVAISKALGPGERDGARERQRRGGHLAGKVQESYLKLRRPAVVRPGRGRADRQPRAGVVQAEIPRAVHSGRDFKDYGRNVQKGVRTPPEMRLEALRNALARRKWRFSDNGRPGRQFRHTGRYGAGAGRRFHHPGNSTKAVIREIIAEVFREGNPPRKAARARHPDPGTGSL